MDTKYTDYDVYEYTPEILPSDEILLAEPVATDTDKLPKKQVRKAIEYYFDRKRLRKDLTFFS